MAEGTTRVTGTQLSFSVIKIQRAVTHTPCALSRGTHSHAAVYVLWDKVVTTFSLSVNGYSFTVAARVS